MNIRAYTLLDRLFTHIEHALETVAGTPEAHRPSPAHGIADAELNDKERRHAAGLMRVNHTGEVCAQALYDGQAILARKEENRAYLYQAAGEETDHLAWCVERLHELESRPSLLNPLWYAGSYAIGALAALAGDKVSLGFVVATEQQVGAHLAEHMNLLPVQDERSRAVLKQMQEDEMRHARNARERGGMKLPFPIPQLMHATSRVMKTVAYRM